MPLLKTATISRSVKVGKYTGIGFLNVPTPRGEVKMYAGDHIVEVEYTRPGRTGEPKSVTKRTQFVVSEDAARALGVFLQESVEEEQVRLAQEAEIARLEAAAEEARKEEARRAAKETK